MKAVIKPLILIVVFSIGLIPTIKSSVNGIRGNNNFYDEISDFFSQSNSKALVMRQGEFLNYTNLKIQHIYDPKSIAVLSKNNFFKDFDYIIVNNYSDPFIYSTRMGEQLNDYRKTSLLFDLNGYRIFSSKGSDTKIDDIQMALKFKKMKGSKYDYNYKYISSHHETPCYYVKPDSKDFIDLEPGLYDGLFLADIEVKEPEKIELFIVDYIGSKFTFSLQDSFYLKVGNNKIKSRFLRSSRPVRYSLQSNKKFKIKNSKISYRKKEKILTEEFYNQKYPNAYFVLNNKNQYCKTLRKNESFVMKTLDKHTKNNVLRFKITGNINISIHEEKSFLFNYLSNPSYFLASQSQSRELVYKLKEDSYVYLTFYNILDNGDEEVSFCISELFFK